MSVPSVREPNLKSRAGSSNLEDLDPPEEVPDRFGRHCRGCIGSFARPTRITRQRSREVARKVENRGLGGGAGIERRLRCGRAVGNRMILTLIRTVDGWASVEKKSEVPICPSGIAKVEPILCMCWREEQTCN